MLLILSWNLSGSGLAVVLCLSRIRWRLFADQALQESTEPLLCALRALQLMPWVSALIHFQFGIQSYAGAWIPWDKPFSIKCIRNILNNHIHWKMSSCWLLELQCYFRGEVFWWFFSFHSSRRCLQGSVAALPGAQQLPEPWNSSWKSQQSNPFCFCLKSFSGASPHCCFIIFFLGHTDCSWFEGSA